MISITRAPAYLTIQDLGRAGRRSIGVPRSGAMDRLALEVLNTLLGNTRGDAALEWALSAGEITFDESVRFAIGGAEAACLLNGRAIELWRTYQTAPGDRLTIGAPSRGRFLYIGVATGIHAEIVLGSRSTYLAGGFGGLDGRMLRTRDVLQSGEQRRANEVRDLAVALPADLRPRLSGDRIRFIHRVDENDTGAGIIAGDFVISQSSDRTGYRLVGDTAMPGGSITSEPVLPGVIQLPPGGEPIVLMADAPTIGGYRIAGAVISADLDALAQRVPGERITLAPVTMEEAGAALEERESLVRDVEAWARNHRTRSSSPISIKPLRP